MKFPCKVDALEGLALPDDRELHLAIGMFDGVHLGHRQVIQNAIGGARRSGGIAGVLTFWPHPSCLFTPEKAVPQIMTPQMKEQVLRSLEVDLIIEQRFDRTFAAIPAEEFVAYLRRCLPSVRGLYVGENWRFGKGRKGDAALLAELGRAAGITVVSAPRLRLDGIPISSTRIRECLREGKMAEANALFGYPYFCESTVIEGRRLGRTLGFPTLNLSWDPPLRPRFGVYAVRVGRARGESEAMIPAIANYGMRPTVEKGESGPLLEVHIPDGDCPFTANDLLRVEWLEFLRPEQSFANVDELKAQILRDIEGWKKPRE